MDTRESLLRIVGEIYGAVGDAERWSACLQSIEALLQGTAGNLLHHDLRTHHGGVLASTIDPAANAAYSVYYHSVDPWVLAVSPGSLVPEQVILGQTLVPHERMTKTEFYTDFGKPYGFTRSLIGIVEASATTTSALTINRCDESPEFDDEDGRMLAVLLPHVRRALALHRRLVSVDAERRALSDVLDRFRAAVVLVNRSQQVVVMNRAASRLAGRRDGFSVQTGRIRGATPEVSAALAAAIASATASASGESLVVDRAHVSMWRPSGRRALDALVIPVVGDVAVLAAIFVTDPDDAPDLSRRVLADRFALSPAEARVANALARGESVKDIAEAFHLTRETTRWYVKQVLAKTGTSSQAQLVRLLLSMTAPLMNPERT